MSDAGAPYAGIGRTALEPGCAGIGRTALEPGCAGIGRTALERYMCSLLTVLLINQVLAMTAGHRVSGVLGDRIAKTNIT